jgi:hypothetical protein
MLQVEEESAAVERFCTALMGEARSSDPVVRYPALAPSLRILARELPRSYADTSARTIGRYCTQPLTSELRKMLRPGPEVL